MREVIPNIIKVKVPPYLSLINEPKEFATIQIINIMNIDNPNTEVAQVSYI